MWRVAYVPLLTVNVISLLQMFNYCKMKRIADVVFALFTLIWIPTRHALFAIPFYSLTFEAGALITVRRVVPCHVTVSRSR